MNLRCIPVFVGVLLLAIPAPPPPVRKCPRRRSDSSNRRSVPIGRALLQVPFRDQEQGRTAGRLVAGILRGGDSGAAVVVGKPDESLLVEAVRQQNGLAMPPDGKLDEEQIAALTQWIHAGAFGRVREAAPPTVRPWTPSDPRRPTTGSLRRIELWLRADSLDVADQETVSVWPDESGHGRDVSATQGVRAGGVGLPARFVRQSSCSSAPAVRFEATRDWRLPRTIQSRSAGMRLSRSCSSSTPAGGGAADIWGDPGDRRSGPRDRPGRPLAAMVQFSRDADSTFISRAVSTTTPRWDPARSNRITASRSC